MKIALEEAEKAFAEGEVPVGAVVVCNGSIVSRAHNLVESLGDATAHAEMLALQKASQQVGNWRLASMVLYSTLEPCAMCLGALFLSRAAKVVYAADDLRHGACGSWVNLLASKHPTHTLDLEKGLFQKEAAELMRAFFKNRREERDALRRCRR